MEVEVRHINELKGNGLFALKDIKVGSVIFEEPSLLCTQFSWNSAYGYRACEFCLRPLETAEENVRRLTGKPEIVLPYPECCTTNKDMIVVCMSCGVEYCSSECQLKAYNQYHQILCRPNNVPHPLNELEETWKHIHYPPETSTIMLIPKILATILQSPNPEEALAQFNRFSHRSVNDDCELAHKFLGEKFVSQISKLRDLISKALYHKDIEQLLTPDGFQTIVALIGTNGQGVGTSPISQWVTRTSELSLNDDEKEVLDKFIDTIYEDMDAHSGNFLNNEGVALFPIQNMCNHSCKPNAETTFLNNNSTVSLVALEDIKLGEEINICYLDECAMQRSKHSRQKILKENYVFVCTCPRCVEETDTGVTSDEEEEDEEQMSE